MIEHNGRCLLKKTKHSKENLVVILSEINAWNTDWPLVHRPRDSRYRAIIRSTRNQHSRTIDISFRHSSRSTWTRKGIVDCIYKSESMEFISVNIILAIILSLLTAVVVLLIVILRNSRGATKTVAPMQRKEKEPEENDERFATGESTSFAVC